MDLTGGGTAILIAASAVLWLVYLVPTWRRRREYLATERNAIRLQQTLRIMAQSTELPAEVRAEMTAREIAAQERTLAARQREEAAIARAREAAAQRAVRDRLVQTAPGLVAEVDAARRGQARLRRSRAATSALTLASLVGFGVAVASGAWAWAALAAFVSLSGASLLVSFARAHRRRDAVTGEVSRPLSPRFIDLAPASAGPRTNAEVGRAWTPVPLPRSRYMTQPDYDEGARPGLGGIDHAAVLTAAAVEAERALRSAAVAAAEAARPAAVPSAPAAAPAVDASAAGDSAAAPMRPVAVDAPVSRFARMGIVDDLTGGVPDLDEVLQRRRAAG